MKTISFDNAIKRFHEWLMDEADMDELIGVLEDVSGARLFYDLELDILKVKETKDYCGFFDGYIEVKE